MKKFLFHIIALVILLTFATPAFAQDEVLVPDSPLDGENVAVPFEDTADQPDLRFVLYTHLDCPHCQNLEKFLRANGIENKIESKQLKGNNAVLEELEGEWKRLNASPDEQGWPFMIYYVDGVEQGYAVGDQPIIDILVDKLQIENPEFPNGAPSNGNSTTNSSGNNMILLIGGVFFAAVIGYGVYALVGSNKGNAKK